MILYFTHNRKPEHITRRFYEYNRAQAQRLGQRWVAITAKQYYPEDQVLPFSEGFPAYADIYKRILHGLTETHPSEPVFLCEDDMLYPDERFSQAMPEPNAVCYNLNVVSLCERGWSFKPQNGIAMSQMFGTSHGLWKNIAKKYEANLTGQAACIEPCSGSEDGPYLSTTCRYLQASIDFRSSHNATWTIGPDDDVFDDLTRWGKAGPIWQQFMSDRKEEENEAN